MATTTETKTTTANGAAANGAAIRAARDDAPAGAAI